MREWKVAYGDNQTAEIILDKQQESNETEPVRLRLDEDLRERVSMPPVHREGQVIHMNVNST